MDEPTKQPSNSGLNFGPGLLYAIARQNWRSLPQNSQLFLSMNDATGGALREDSPAA
jgi:hypothetical protein